MKSNSTLKTLIAGSAFVLATATAVAQGGNGNGNGNGNGGGGQPFLPNDGGTSTGVINYGGDYSSQFGQHSLIDRNYFDLNTHWDLSNGILSFGGNAAVGGHLKGTTANFADYVKVGTNSVYLVGSPIFGPFSGNDIFSTNGPLVINRTGATAGLVTSTGENTILNPNGGVVGIGTLNPIWNLSVNNSASNFTFMQMSNNTSTPNAFGLEGMLFGPADHEVHLKNCESNGGIHFWTSPTGLGSTQERLTIDPNGNLSARGTSNAFFSVHSTDVNAGFVLGVASGTWAYSSNTIPGDIVIGPKGGQSHDLILSAQNNNQGSIRFKSGPIGSDAELMTILHNGNVGIGITNPQNPLEVCGLIRAEELIIEDIMGCDFVFEDDYYLRSLEEVEAFINENNRLPEIPAAAEVEAEGMKMGDFQSKMWMKVEELTLYMIEANKQIKELQAENEALKSEIKDLGANAKQ